MAFIGPAFQRWVPARQSNFILEQLAVCVFSQEGGRGGRGGRGGGGSLVTSEW